MLLADCCVPAWLSTTAAMGAAAMYSKLLVKGNLWPTVLLSVCLSVCLY